MSSLVTRLAKTTNTVKEVYQSKTTTARSERYELQMQSTVAVRSSRATAECTAQANEPWSQRSTVYVRRCSCHFDYTGNRGNVRQIIYWPTILSTAWWIITDAVRSHMYAQQGLWHGRVWTCRINHVANATASGLRRASGSREKIFSPSVVK